MVRDAHHVTLRTSASGSPLPPDRISMSHSHRSWARCTRALSAIVLASAVAATATMAVPNTARAGAPSSLNVSKASGALGAPSNLRVNGLDRPADLEDLT